MCGIYGFTGKPTKETASIIQRLGILNESRGRDSTGIALIAGGTTRIFKKAVNSSRFFMELQKTQHVSDKRNCKFLTILGHTRMATRGDVTDKNAHPFKYKDIIFTHNGVIFNFDELQQTFKTKYEVDSQIIGHLLAEKDYKAAFKKLSGSFAVPFIDKRQPDMLQVAVHSQVFAFAYKGDQLYYSSELSHLKQALKGMKFQICRGGADVLYKFYMVGNSLAISKEKIEAKTYIQSDYLGYSYNWDYWKQEYKSQSTSAYDNEYDYDTFTDKYTLKLNKGGESKAHKTKKEKHPGDKYFRRILD